MLHLLSYTTKIIFIILKDASYRFLVRRQKIYERDFIYLIRYCLQRGMRDIPLFVLLFLTDEQDQKRNRIQKILRLVHR